MIIFEDLNTVTIATIGSDNPKTGRMVQLWHLNRHVHPAELRKSGMDAETTCKGCRFASGEGCYVSSNPLGAVWKKYKGCGYLRLSPASSGFDAFFRNQKVRFGAFGNPSLLPLSIVEKITTLSSGWTGYFHDWHLMDEERAKAYGRFFMASCEPDNQAKAKALGLRTFTVIPEGGGNGLGMVCPNVTKGIQCIQCKLCSGSSRQLPDVVIPVHGYQVKKALAKL